MSKFFQSSADSDSESSASSDTNNDNSDDRADAGARAVNDQSQDTLDISLPATQAWRGGISPAQALEAANASQHRDALLHALLEERCINEAIKEAPHGSSRADDPRIRAAAQAKYQRLCAQLAPYGLVSSYLDGEAHYAVRQRYREGLDILSRLDASNRHSRQRHDVPMSLRRLLTAPNRDAPLSLDFSRMELGSLQSMPPPFASVIPARPMFDVGRYCNEFDELGVLGKGGYGVVYHARHKLDGQTYAVKKVPLSSSCRRRLAAGGQSELDNILRELRTLAKLDHPNIVRYHNGWVEWTHFRASSVESSTSPRRRGFLLMEHASRSFDRSSDDSQNSLSRVNTVSATSGTDIIFEDSGARQSSPNETSDASKHFDGLEGASRLSRVLTNNTNATVSEVIVEDVSRSGEPSSSVPFRSSTGGETVLMSDEPCPAVHMQMAMYPMTLAEYISPPSRTDAAAPPLMHCFHLQPSVYVILAVLDGVEYLNNQGIIHRDLKPGNIFLAPNNHHRHGRASDDLFQCETCREQGTAQPMSLNVRIGDFGLVAVVTDEEPWTSSPEKRAVGTEMYRPTQSPCIPSLSLDIFALGIIFFELVWRFGTRMERIHTIRRLKAGIFPDDFVQRTGDRNGRIRACITAMLGISGSNGISIRRIREMVIELAR